MVAAAATREGEVAKSEGVWECALLPRPFFFPTSPLPSARGKKQPPAVATRAPQRADGRRRVVEPRCSPEPSGTSGERGAAGKGGRRTLSRGRTAEGGSRRILTKRVHGREKRGIDVSGRDAHWRPRATSRQTLGSLIRP